ncbi:hypothetical protein M422DRAFT_171237, partial [Sphaerobolus stellatus SS14]
LQQKLHEYQLQQRRAVPGSHPDILLLLEHRPVYTAGRRQNEAEISEEAERLCRLGADFVSTKRGGQTTYHGPGQVVGYPLFDLGRMHLSIAQYICKIQTSMKRHLLENYGIQSTESDNTGVFLSPTRKIGSIGVQVRHRLTNHGLAYNVTPEPLKWFDQVVACGLTDVKAACISEAAGRDVSVQDDLTAFIPVISRVFDRELLALDLSQEGTVELSIRELEQEAEQCKPWPTTPLSPFV